MAPVNFDAEKDAQHIEASDPSQGTIREHEDLGVSHAEGRRIIHKIDRRLISALGLMFGISLMDRTNLGAANIAGMSVELQLGIGTRYSIAIIMFFVPYIICQWPSAVFARKVGPRIFLPAATAAWGIVMLGTGFIHHWGELVALRAVVGVFEAGLFPGALFLLQMWYCRYDVHKRYASFYLISIVGSSLSGVLAYGFMQMAGVGGYEGWRYIFIWEGVLTCLIAIIGAVLIVDFPQKAQNSWKFLKPHELEYVIRLLERDRNDAYEEPFSLSAFFKAGLDLKIWLFGLIFFASTVMAYAISFFLPIILHQKMGFSVGISQLMTTPPYFFAAIFMYTEGWVGDKYHIRGPIIVLNALLGICGLCLLSWTKPAGSQYFGVFLVTAASNSTIPTVMAYQANNIRGTWKRAFSSASLITMGAIGGIVGALVYRSQDAPQYFPGTYASFACCVLQVFIVGVLSLHFRKMNKKVTLGAAVIEGLPGFLYTL
ncbi:phthalate transporter [Cadophora sp. DSE1049]|nr:phthalate transporter [Cadophora sp. DSE1049]